MTKAQTTWDTMTPRQRLAAVNIDIMDHIDFSILSGLVTMGEIHVVPDLPTAGTNGVDVFYGEAFVMTLNRKQSDAPEPLLDPKYYNKAFVDILQDLLRNPPPPPPRRGKPEDGQGGDGQDEQDGRGGIPKPLDEHIPTPKGLDKDELSKRVRDALTHGEMVQKRIAKNAGKASAGNPLSGLGRKRDTDWRNALRDWVQEICAGDEYSRYNPPNRRMLPLGIILPTHFDVAMDELHIYCDTSGSMHGVYPVVFGEIANICSQANPETVRIVWWDSKVCGEQVFKRGQYDLIANQLAPKGGGGTSPQCVIDYVQSKQYKPSGAIWLTDGYLDACPTPACGNELWGVVDNDHFNPAHGKALRIHS
jgi:hypothetical protein